MAGVSQPDLVLGPFEQLLRSPPSTPPAERKRRAQAYAALADGAGLKSYKSGDTAARHGDPAEYMCVVQAGEMSIYVGDWDDDPTLLRVCGAGSVWGEVGLANMVLPPAGQGNERRTTRSANVRATSDVTARILRYSQVNRLRTQHPQIDAIIVELLAGLVVKLTLDIREREARLPTAVRLRACLTNLLREQHSDDGWLAINQTAVANRLRLGRPHVNQLLKAEREARRIATRNGAARMWVDIELMEEQTRRDRDAYPVAL
jgi:CRP-like cAMP-binding protein